MLRRMLNTHPDRTCHGEVFSIRREPNLGRDYHMKISKTTKELAELRAADMVDFLHRHVWERKDCKAIGAKIKYRQLEEQYPAILQAILDDPEILIIHLTRKNLLKRYVSNRLVIAQKTPTVITNRAAKASEKFEIQVKTIIDPEKCIDNMKETRASEKRFKSYFQGHHVFDMVYETFINQENQSMMKLQSVLGVDPMPLEPKTVKINSDNLEDLVENFDELTNTLQDTIFSHYLKCSRS